MEQLQLIFGSGVFRRWIVEVLSWFFLVGATGAPAHPIAIF